MSKDAETGNTSFGIKIKEDIMKKITIIGCVLALTLGLFTGCGCSASVTDMTTNTTNATTMPPSTTKPATTPSTQATTEVTMPGMDDMIPGSEDTIDPSNGANQTDARTRY